MHLNQEKITKEFCQGRTLIFRPKTVEEAEKIQRRLFGMGYRWRMSGDQVIMQEDCVEKGLTLRDNGHIHLGVSDDDMQKGFLCTLEQFDKADLAANLKLLEDPTLRTIFNYFNNEIAGLRAEVEELKKEVSDIKRTRNNFETGPP